MNKFKNVKKRDKYMNDKKRKKKETETQNDSWSKIIQDVDVHMTI